MPERTRHVVALYEIDAATEAPRKGAGGTTAARCGACCASPRPRTPPTPPRRANRLLDRLQRGRPSPSSVIYDGGRYAARVFAGTAPPFFPETRPRYE